MKILLPILVLFLCVNVGILYYLIFFEDFPDFDRRLSFIETRLERYISAPEASSSSSLVQNNLPTPTPLSQSQQDFLVSEITRQVKRELAEDALDEQVAAEGQTGFAPINRNIFEEAVPRVYYVPLGQATGKSSSNDWVDTPVEIDFNLADYREVDSVRFEATVRIPTGNGQVKARLYDTKAGPVGGSEVTGEGIDGQYVKSGPINIAEGNRTLRLQLLTTLNFEAVIENARLRVVLAE